MGGESFTNHSGNGCLEDESMRILMASDLFHPFLLGGGETRMYEIARRLAKKHEIHVLTRRFRGLPSYEVHEGVHIHRVFVPSAGIKFESLKMNFSSFVN